VRLEFVTRDNVAGYEQKWKAIASFASASGIARSKKLVSKV
jgi:hypothetical protein